MPTLLPSAPVAFVAWAKAQPDLVALQGTRVGTRLNAQLPATRVQRIGGSPDAYDGTDSPSLQIECWGKTEGDADDLVRTLLAVLPEFRHRAVVGGRSYTYEITSGPFWAPDDPSLSSSVRYILTLTLLTSA